MRKLKSVVEAKLLDLKQVMLKCGLSKSTIYSYCKKGLFPQPIRLGRVIRWNADELDRWIAARCGPLLT